MHSPAEWSELWPEGTSSRGWSHSGIALLTDNRVAFAHPDSPGRRKWGRLSLDCRQRTQIFARDPAIQLPSCTGQGGETEPRRQHCRRTSPARNGCLRQPFWNPTAFTIDDIAEGGCGAMWVADGYATNLLHHYDQHGNYSRSVDGSPSGIPFSVPHGLIIDRRSAEPRLVVADRSNQRIVAIDHNDNVRIAYPSPDGHDMSGWPNTPERRFAGNAPTCCTGHAQ